MSMDEIIKNAVIKISVDSKKATKELGNFVDETEEANKALKEAAEKAKAAEKAFDLLGLGAKNNSEKIKKIGDSLHGWGGRGVEGINKFAKALGPWNQALELGGKVLKVAEAGLEEYAKTSEQAALEVKKLTDEFTGYKDALLAMAGATTVAIAGQVQLGEELEKTLYLKTMFDSFNKAKDSITPYQVMLRSAQDMQKSIKTVGALSSVFHAASDTIFDDWRNVQYGGSVDSFLGKAKSQYDDEERIIAEFDKRAADTYEKKIVDAATKRNELAKALAEERRKFTNAYAKSVTDDLVASLEASSGPQSQVDMNGGSFAGLINPQSMRDNFDLQGALNKQNAAGYEAFNTDKKNTFLESTFGSLDDFNAYATAFQTLTGAVTAGLDAWIDGSMSAGQAVKRFLHDALKGLASQMAVEALKHGAYALGSLAFGDVKGAATHGAAAAAFGGAAVAAAVAAKSLGSGGAAPSAGGGSASAGGAGASAGGGSGGNGGSTTNYIIVGSDLNDDSPRMRQRKYQRVVDIGSDKTSVGGSF